MVVIASFAPKWSDSAFLTFLPILHKKGKKWERGCKERTDQKGTVTFDYFQNEEKLEYLTLLTFLLGE